MSATNAATFRRVVDAVNAHDEQLVTNAIDEVFHPHVRIGTPLPVRSTGVQAVHEVFATLCRAFPDLHLDVRDVIAEHDKVVFRLSVTGTHLGQASTGRQVRYDEIFIFRFTDTRITELWGVVDALTLMKQLGQLPTS
jgi:predicted ester cyclase